MSLHLGKKIVGLLLVTSFVSGLAFSPLATPHEQLTVHAQGAGDAAVGVAACALVGYLLTLLPAGIAVPISDAPQTWKEAVFDCVLYGVANALIFELTGNVVAWSQNGFAGNPIWSTNLKSHVIKIADDVAGQFIENKLNFLCRPFQLSIRVGLAEYYGTPFYQRSSCRLTDVIERVDDFLEGDFVAGGWDGWFQLTQSPQNNPYGSFLLARDELERQLLQRDVEQRQELSFGKGLFPVKRCKIWMFGDKPKNKKENKCVKHETTTPGNVVADRLNDAIGKPGDRLADADEMNEVINAVVMALVTSILQDDGGLLEYDAEAFLENVSERTDIGGASGFSICDGGFAGGSSRSVSESAYTIGEPGDDKRLGLGLDGHYSTAQLEFDFYLDDFEEHLYDPRTNKNVFQPFFALQNEGRGIEGPSCFFGAALRPTETIFYLCENVPTPGDTNQYWLKQSATWEKNQWYHVSVGYDASARSAQFTGRKISAPGASGGEVVSQLQGAIANSIYPVGNGTVLQLGGNDPGSALHNPLYGSEFRNVSLTLNPGAAVCGGVGVGEPLGGPGIEV